MKRKPRFKLERESDEVRGKLHPCGQGNGEEGEDSAGKKRKTTTGDAARGQGFRSDVEDTKDLA
jgi:hypothetical protein